METDKSVTQALMTKYARLGQSFWCELLTKHVHCIWNWNTKTNIQLQITEMEIINVLKLSVADLYSVEN